MPEPEAGSGGRAHPNGAQSRPAPAVEMNWRRFISGKTLGQQSRYDAKPSGVTEPTDSRPPRRDGRKDPQPSLLRTAIRQYLRAQRGFWTAVAERSDDTAFRLRPELPKRRGAPLPAAVQKGPAATRGFALLRVLCVSALNPTGVGSRLHRAMSSAPLRSKGSSHSTGLSSR